MPRGKENYLCVDPSVAVDPKDVDALVTKIGEALQLHAAAVGHAHTGKLRGQKQNRAGPYGPPGDPIRPWNRKRVRVQDEDDPQRLLQELLLSGNLIKEAVRRLQACREPPDGGAR
ncbi:glycogen synthase kinase binding protein [Pholidichthys leucotaenia]